VGLLETFAGLFSKSKRDQGALRRLSQKVTERYGPPENRQKAIEQLAGLGSEGALATLCLRFTVRSDVGITDDEEKATVLDHLVKAGARAIPAVKGFLERQESGVSWGLRVLAELVPPEEVVATVVALLDRAGRTYSRDPEKKLVLLSWLTEHHAPAAARAADAPATPVEAAILPLLEDFSDDVRIAATRALSRLGASEGGRAALVALLLRDTGNARVRGEVLEALCLLAADVKGHRPSVEPLLVEPFFLDREGRVKRRG
jgi:hypothetical protein